MPCGVVPHLCVLAHVHVVPVDFHGIIRNPFPNAFQAGCSYNACYSSECNMGRRACDAMRRGSFCDATTQLMSPHPLCEEQLLKGVNDNENR